MSLAPRILCALALAAMACGGRPLPGSFGTAFAEFASEVVPVLENRCAAAGCHATPARGYDELAREHPNELWIPVEPDGRLPRDEPTLRRILAAITRSDGPEPLIAVGDPPEASELLLRPLPEELSGRDHRGVAAFSGRSDPGYLALAKLVARSLGSAPAPRATRELSAFETLVLPVLERNGCFLRACHGADAFNDLKLVPPIPASPETSPRFDAGADWLERAGILERTIDRPNQKLHDRERPPTPLWREDAGQRREPELVRYPRWVVEANRRQALGTVTRFVDLTGDPRSSRLLRKVIPIEKGGIHHRGGNDQFLGGFDDTDAKQILEWIELERAALARTLTSAGEPIGDDLGRPRGLAYLSGATHTPREWFDLSTYWPGTKLMLLPISGSESATTAAGLPIDLSSRFFDRPVEIQGFDVRYDARAIVLSARARPDQGFTLYEIRLDRELSAQSIERLSFGPERDSAGTPISRIDPIYAPSGDANALDEAAVIYAETGPERARVEPTETIGEADGGDSTCLVDRERTEAAGTFEGLELEVIEGPMRGTLRTVTRHESLPEDAGSRLCLDRPLAELPNRSTIYLIKELTGGRSESRSASPAVRTPSSERAPRPTFAIWRLPAPLHQESRESAWSAAVKLTHRVEPDRRPTLRTSGEIMFTSLRSDTVEAGRPVYNAAIFRVFPGGNDYHIHGGNRSRYLLYSDSRELGSGLEIRLVGDPRGLYGSGALVLADHALGPNAEAENPLDRLETSREAPRAFDASIQRFLPSQLPIFPETGPDAVAAVGLSPGGVFRDPMPAPDGGFTVAFARGPVDQRSPAAAPDFDLYLGRFRSTPHRLGGEALEPVDLQLIAAASSKGRSEHSPRLVFVRPKEPHPIHGKYAAESVLLARPRLERGLELFPKNTPGVVECYDFPLLTSFLTFFTPSGQRERLPIARVRIGIERAATPGSIDATPARGVLAEFPLEPDGSFQAKVPSDRALFFQPVGADGRALTPITRRFYVRPGERLTFSIPSSLFPVRCAGCHGSLTGSPDDALGPPDVVTAASRVMANWDPRSNQRRGPMEATIGRTYGFETRVWPIIHERCVSCHDESRAVVLDSARSAFHALRGYDAKGALASESRLVRLLSPPGGHAPGMTPAELVDLATWRDLGAPFASEVAP